MKFYIFLDSDKLFRWHLKATNGEIIANGEAYKNKKDCQHAIALIQSTTNKTRVIDATEGLK